MSKPAEDEAAAGAFMEARPRRIVAVVLGLGSGMAAAWLAMIALLLVLAEGPAKTPAFVGPLTGAIGIAAGIGVVIGVSRCLGRANTDERSIWNHPPGFILALAVVQVCLWVAYLITDFGDLTVLWLLVAAIALFALGTTWLIRLLVVLERRRFEPTGRSIAGVLLSPAVVIALMIFGTWDGTMHFRFEVSESALTADAREALAAADADALRNHGGQRVANGRTVGVLDFDSVSVHAECAAARKCDPETASVEYSISGGFFSTFTYIYSPTGQPSTDGVLEHLGGPWWFSEWHD